MQDSRVYLWTSLIIAAIASLGLRSAAMAQEATKEAATKAATADQGELLPLLRDFKEVILLHYDEIGRLKLPSSVNIPYEKFLEMQRRLQEKESSAKDGSLFSLSLEGQVSGRRAELTATIQARVDNPSGAAIDLRMLQAQLTEAVDEQGKLANLERTADGYRLLIGQAGPAVFRFKMFVEINELAGGRRRLELLLPESTVKRVVLTFAQPPTAVWNTRTEQRLTESRPGLSVAVPLAAADSLDIAWQESEEAASNPVLASTVSSVLSVSIEQFRIHTEAKIQLKSAAPTRELWLRIAPNEQVQQLSAQQEGTLVATTFDAPVKAEKHGRVRIKFAEPIVGDIDMALNLVREQSTLSAEQGVAIGHVEVESAAAQTGRILLHSGLNLRMKSAEAGPSTRRIAVAQLEPALQRPMPARAYLFAAQPAEITVFMDRAQPLLTARTDHEIDLGPTSADIESRFRVTNRGATTEQLRVRLPVDLTNVEVGPPETVELLSEAHDDASGLKDLTLALIDPSTREWRFSVRGSFAVQSAQESVLRLPISIDDPNNSGTVTVRSASNIRPVLLLQATKNLVREPIEENASNGAIPTWYFRQLRAPAELAFQFETLPQQIKARVDLELHWTEESMRVIGDVRLEARFEPLERLVFRVPENADRFVVTGDQLLPERASEGKMVAYSLAKPASSCRVRVEMRIPTSDSDGFTVVPIVVPERATLVESVATCWAGAGQRVIAAPPWKVRLDRPTEPAGPAGAPTARLYAVEPADSIRLRFEPTSLATFVIPRALVEETMSASGRRQGRLRLYIADRLASAITFQLPTGCSLIGPPFVDGKEANLIALDDALFQTQLPEGSSPASVELEYFCDGSGTLGAWSSIALHIPTIVEDSATREIQWLVRTETDRLLFPSSNSFFPFTSWRFRGAVLPATVPAGASSGLDWLRSADQAALWTVTNDDSSEVGHVWLFRGWSTAGVLHVRVVRTSLWLLAWSGLALVVALGMLRVPPDRRWQVGASCFVVAAALGLLAPESALWVWFGMQWGAMIVVALLVFRSVGRVRRRTWMAQRRGSAIANLIKAGSALRNVGTSLSRSPAPHVGPVGTTVDHR